MMKQYRVTMDVTLVETFEHVVETIDEPNAHRFAMEAADRQYPDASDISVTGCELLDPTGAEVAAPTDPLLVVATKALRTIYDGSWASGRWLTLDGDEVGSCDTKPDAGYYNADDPPAGYGPEGWIATIDCPDEPPQMPAQWYPYTGREQRAWLQTVARQAKEALKALGIDPDKAPEPPIGSMVGGAS